MIPRPQPDEYAPYYADYLTRIPEGADVLGFLSTQLDALLHTLARIPDSAAAASWQPGKWTLKQEVGHLIDVERIFSYRATCIARGEQQPQPGFEQEDYAREAGSDLRTLADLAREFEMLRRANLLQFAHLTPEQAARRGTAGGNPFTVRAILHVMAGHTQRHLEKIRKHYGK
ncbi:MAG: DinB family protein [Acidobacteriales bacterium]|nr:DinB family protein [Terriglobales bacterium]